MCKSQNEESYVLKFWLSQDLTKTFKKEMQKWMEPMQIIREQNLACWIQIFHVQEGEVRTVDDDVTT